MSNLYYITNARPSVRGQKVDLSQIGTKKLDKVSAKGWHKPKWSRIQFEAISFEG